MMEQNPFEGHEQDERAVRREVRRFEEMERGDNFHFFDLVTLDDIYFWYLNNNRLADALKVMEYASRFFPANDEIHFKKATVLFDSGNLEEAEEEISSAIHLNSANTEYHFLYSEILCLSGKYDEAIEVLQALLFESEDPAEIKYQMGMIAQMSGEEEQSEEFFRGALSEDPGFEEPAMELAYLLESMSRADDAIRVLKEFLDESPFCYQAWFNLGSLFGRMGLHEEAIESYEFALAIHEDFSHAWFRKGTSLMALRKYQEAIPCFLEATVMEKPDLQTLFHIAECYEMMGNLSLARKYFLKCSRISPERSEPWTRLADILGSEGKYIEAIHFYRKGLDHARDQFDILLGMAMCEYKLGNPASAGEALEKAIALQPRSLKLWRDWSATLNEEDNLPGAILFLQEGLKNNPDMPELYFLLGTYLFQAGSADKGLSMIENGLILDFSKHSLIFEACPDMDKMPGVSHLINQYKPC